jgi:hypothetical protein
MPSSSLFLSRRRSSRLTLIAALSVALPACVDTDLDVADTPVACPTPAEALENVVHITADLGDLGFIRCSGVAVTHTLVVTALGCVMVPNEVADLYGIPPGEGDEPTGDVYHSGATEDADCNAGDEVEDGSFSSQFGAPLPPQAMRVYLGSEREDGEGHTVAEILRAPATRCSEGIALLKLTSRVELGSVPIRPDPRLEEEEAIVLSYLSVASSHVLERQEVAVTLDGTGVQRSLETSETCPEQSGGGFFSVATGALVGVLASSVGSFDCTTLAEGRAVRLSAFRRMLIDAAAPERLVEEPGSKGLGMVACRPH